MHELGLQVMPRRARTTPVPRPFGQWPPAGTHGCRARAGTARMLAWRGVLTACVACLLAMLLLAADPDLGRVVVTAACALMVGATIGALVGRRAPTGPGRGTRHRR